jgi:hypothetical protein
VSDAAARDLVRRGYDAVSHAYRVDGSGGAHPEQEYERWLAWVPTGRVLDHEHVPEGDVSHTLVRAQLP